MFFLFKLLNKEIENTEEGPVELDSPIAKDQKKPENTSGEPDESTKEGRDAKVNNFVNLYLKFVILIPCYHYFHKLTGIITFKKQRRNKQFNYLKFNL